MTADGWATWLAEANHEWDTFATFTIAPRSRNYSSRVGSIEYQDPTLPALRRALAEFNDRFQPNRCAWFSERGAAGGRVHAHALISHQVRENRGLTSDRSYFFRYWKDRFGRCRFDAFDPQLGAAGYCAKYLTKRSFDYDYYRNNR